MARHFEAQLDRRCREVELAQARGLSFPAKAADLAVVEAAHAPFHFRRARMLPARCRPRSPPREPGRSIPCRTAESDCAGTLETRSRCAVRAPIRARPGNRDRCRIGARQRRCTAKLWVDPHQLGERCRVHSGGSIHCVRGIADAVFKAVGAVIERKGVVEARRSRAIISIDDGCDDLDVLVERPAAPSSCLMVAAGHERSL